MAGDAAESTGLRLMDDMTKQSGRYVWTLEKELGDESSRMSSSSTSRSEQIGIIVWSYVIDTKSPS